MLADTQHCGHLTFVRTFISFGKRKLGFGIKICRLSDNDCPLHLSTNWPDQPDCPREDRKRIKPRRKRLLQANVWSQGTKTDKDSGLRLLRPHLYRDLSPPRYPTSTCCARQADCSLIWQSVGLQRDKEGWTLCFMSLILGAQAAVRVEGPSLCQMSNL